MAGSTTRLPLPSSLWETLVLAQSCLVCGPGASAELLFLPSEVALELFRTLLLEILRLPVQITDARCECGAATEPRAFGLEGCGLEHWERTLARVNAKLRDMNVAARTDDMRSIEVALGLPLYHGAQLAVDITLRCALTAASQACTNAATVNIAVCTRARAEKEAKYTELVSWSSRCLGNWGQVERGGCHVHQRPRSS